MSKDDTTTLFHCVQCMMPSSSLYKYYSFSSVKLTRCSYCANDVDFYVERESILIFIDLFLLRKSAYRHVLLNYQNHSNQGEQVPPYFQSFTIVENFGLVVKLLVLICGLETYFKYETWNYKNSSIHLEDNENEKISLLRLFFSSMIELLLLCFLSSSLQFLFLYRFKAVKKYQLIKLFSNFFLVNALPMIFQIIPLIILIWDRNVFIIRIISCIYIYLFRWISNVVILEQTLLLSYRSKCPEHYKPLQMEYMLYIISGISLILSVIAIEMIQTYIFQVS